MNTPFQPLQKWFTNNAGVMQGAAAPLLVVAILSMMVLPLPPLLLDMFFTVNIAVALMVMMVAAYMLRPLDFAAFPAVLLPFALLALFLKWAALPSMAPRCSRGPPTTDMGRLGESATQASRHLAVRNVFVAANGSSTL